MKLRKFGKTNEMVSPLAFGCMRLPVINGEYGKIDGAEAIAQIRYAIDHGVNYIDTAYPYHEGTSEKLVGKALENGYRQKVHLATKLPSWLINTHEDMERYLDEQLKNLQTDTIDFYLIHALNRKYWDNYMKLDLFAFIEKAKKDGKIKHIGFSFHDEIDVFKEIVEAYDWEFCMIQHNFMDENYQAGNEGLKFAAERGLGIAIMEPLRGGNLIKNVPDDVMEVWNSHEANRTPAQWALSYLWNKPEIGVVLSGMNAYEQIDENILEATRTEASTLSESEKNTIDQVKKVYQSRMLVDCTGCKYCMPCPTGVNIPLSFQIYNHGSMFQNMEGAKENYNGSIKMENRASACVDCGKCEKVCPQNLPIRKLLKDVVTTFEK